MTRRARLSTFVVCVALVLTGLAVSHPLTLRAQPARPNIVLIFPDNLGWGEVGAYGSVRGPLTPRIDKLAAEGIRLNNFNVEFSCTVSRAALMTGRYAIRTGATQGSGHHAVGSHDRRGAESVGYATALYGKWHLGGDRPDGARAFAAGIRRVLRHSAHQQRSADDHRAGQKTPDTSFIWEGKAGEPARNVKPFNLETRRTIDRESADRGVAFMERNAQGAQAVLPLLPDDADPFPDARASRFRRQDRAPATSATRWPRWMRTSAACSTRSTGWASPATRSCCGAPTTAPSSGVRGADRPDRGQASTTA